jgi:UDP-GlcNAc:undecaprenyl-phosphate GlcNAc-1-phosphate transferase
MSPVLIAFAAALAGGLALTPLVRGAARRLGWVAKPRSDRWHTQTTALSGGVAIYGAFVLAVAAYALLSEGRANPLQSLPASGFGIVLTATLMFVVGFLDDRLRLRPASKLLAQVVGAAVVISFGVVYPLTDRIALNVLATVFWFLAITNALNLLDNMDGVAAGVAAIGSVFLGGIFFTQGQVGLAAVCAALAGATLGFLPYNFNPASIFMGDSGSLVLGSIIASLGVLYPSTAAVGIVPVLFVPVFIVIIPIVDTLLVTTTRTLAGRPISTGGRDHASHRLVALGLSERQAALLLYAFALAGGFLGFALGTGTPGPGSMVVSFLFLVALGLCAAYLARMRVYTGPQVRENHRVTVLVSDLLHKKRAAEFVLDVVLFTLAAYTAYLLRYDGRIPAEQMAILEQSLALVVAAYAVSFGALGVYRGEWSRASIADAHRVIKAVAVGALLSTTLVVLFFRTAYFSRSVLMLNALLVAVLTLGSRLTFRSMDVMRSAFRHDGETTLVYGAGRRGEIVVRELQANPRLGLRPIGYVDDNVQLSGRVLLGLPVLGAGADLPRLIERHKVTRLVLATGTLPERRWEEVQRVALLSGVRMHRFAFGLEVVEPPLRRPFAAVAD